MLSPPLSGQAPAVRRGAQGGQLVILRDFRRITCRRMRYSAVCPHSVPLEQSMRLLSRIGSLLASYATSC